MLLSINAVIDDAEEKQMKNLNVKAWLDEVKDAVYVAEDLLDEIDTEVSKRELEAEDQTHTSKVWNLFPASLNSFDKEIESRMKEVLENLEYLANKTDLLGLKGSGVGIGSGSKVSERLPSTSLVDEAAVYGRDDDKNKIIDWLLCDGENFNHVSVISIVGMGGMGKTTLAQLVYNDPRMEEEFDLKAWVCVSDEFDVFRATKTILEAITMAVDDTRDLNILQVKLKEKLTGKRFLLVLDDIWNENRFQWETLRTPFDNGDHKSKILVTTRSGKVASTMRSTQIHHLERLPEEDCWLLFAKHAFHDGVPHSNPELEEVGRKIIQNCKGLPLALKTIGSLLYTKSSLEEWESILKSEIWNLPDDDNNIIPALRLSYHYLPSHLKRCFAYCSLFPNDYEFDKTELILLWMAENFLQCPQHNKSLEEVGEQFFNDLLLRSFFQRSSGGAESRFIMHDLLSDLAKYVSGEFCFRLEVNEAPDVPKMTRHFSYLQNFYETAKRFEGLYKANRLRTFLPLSMHRNVISHRHMSGKLIHDMLSMFKCLRVLSLSGYFHITELPDSLGNLKHLRYLDSSSTAIKELPNSICLLYNLQTLKLKNCESLEKLPMDLHKLINLRHLDFRQTKVRKMPMQLAKLKNLQVLTSFNVGKCSDSNIQQLGDLNLRGSLSISELQNVAHPLDALAVNLKNKFRLLELSLEWNMNHDESQKERDVFENLQPPKNLKKLSIRHYGGTRFPNVWRRFIIKCGVSRVEQLSKLFLVAPTWPSTISKDIAYYRA